MKEIAIEVEPVDNAYIIATDEMKTAAWFCKNENKWHNIDCVLGKELRCIVETITDAGLSVNGKIRITITPTIINNK